MVFLSLKICINTAVDTFLPAGLFLYLPLDGSPEDYSAYHRSPDASDVVNIQYNGADRKKLSAAYFNGSAYIQINSFSLVTIGEVSNCDKILHELCIEVTT